MTLHELKALLKSTGYPVAYYQFKKPPTIPFIVYMVNNSRNFGADGGVYKKIDDISIELYTDKKDPIAEKTLETILDSAGLFYDKSEAYIESEELYQITYESEAI